MVITSKDNESIKQIRKLKDKKYRDFEQKYIVEGIRMIEEAIDEKAEIDTIVVCEECITDGSIENKLLYEIAKYNCIYVSKQVFQSITEVMNPQGVLAIIKRKNAEENINFNEDIIVALDDIQDPGNMGTILRTIDSVGLTQLIASKNSADVFNPKVVRSTMGAIYRVNVIQSNNLVETLKNIKKHKFDIVVTSLETDSNIYDLRLEKKVIVIGNEGNGVSKEVQELANIKSKIPMFGKTESLNASVATGVILYEYIRQNKL